jgi:hypothetical protein
MVYPWRETNTDHDAPRAFDMASKIKVSLSGNARDAKTDSKTAGLQGALDLVSNPGWVVFRSVMLVRLCGNSSETKARFPLSPKRHSVLRVLDILAQGPGGPKVLRNIGCLPHLQLVSPRPGERWQPSSHQHFTVILLWPQYTVFI